MNASNNLVGLMVLVGFGMATLAADGALVSHYEMEGNATDSQGVQNGSINGSPSTVPGKIGDAISFNAGVGDQALRDQNMSVTDPGNGAQIPTNITVSAWVNTTDGGSFRGLVDKIASSYGVLLDINNGFARLQTGNSSMSNSGGPSSINPVNDGAWHLITGTFQTDGGPLGSGTGTLYVDGVFQGSLAGNYEGNAGTSMNVPGDVPVNSTWAMDGVVDDVALWSDVLTSPEARALFSLADTLALNYHAAFAQSLFDLHDAASGSDLVDGTTWYYTTGLGGTEGVVVDLGGGNFSLRLDASGTGVSTIPIPEPASSVLLAFGLFALGAFRRRR